MWSGNLTFGLVHVPVKVYAATQDNSIAFHQVHVTDGGRIKYQRECQVCHQVVAFADIAKGYEDASGRRVIITESDLEGLPVAHSRDIEILTFVPVTQIDPIHFDKAYFLEPAANAAKPYVLLRQALAGTERMAVVMFAMRQRTRIGVLRVRDDVLVLQTMLWPDEVRVAQFDGIGDDDIRIRPQELAMAGSLVDSLSADFDPQLYHDEYREAVAAMLEAKLAGIEVAAPDDAADEAGAQVVDLMAALAESVRRTQAARGQAVSASLEQPSPGPDEPAAKPAKRPKAGKPGAGKPAAAGRPDTEDRVDSQAAGAPKRRPGNRQAKSA
jgi:DNA end-binding protein Ku